LSAAQAASQAARLREDMKTVAAPAWSSLEESKPMNRRVRGIP